MNIYIARNQAKVPVYLYDDELDTVYQLDPVSNRQEPTEAPEAPGRKKYTRKMKKSPPPKMSKVSKKGQRGAAHCKVCGGYGHFAKTCPERKPEAEKTKIGTEEGLIETTDIRTQVQELKADGKTSVEIAEELGITLKEVNKYW